MDTVYCSVQVNISNAPLQRFISDKSMASTFTVKQSKLVYILNLKKLKLVGFKMCNRIF